jgi:hypothetical protein
VIEKERIENDDNSNRMIWERGYRREKKITKW